MEMKDLISSGKNFRIFIGDKEKVNTDNMFEFTSAIDEILSGKPSATARTYRKIYTAGWAQDYFAETGIIIAVDRDRYNFTRNGWEV